MNVHKPELNKYGSAPSVLWYVRRLRVMSAAEVIARIRDHWGRRRLRLQYQRSRDSGIGQPEFDPERFSFCQRPDPCLPDLEWDMDSIRLHQDDLLEGRVWNLNYPWQWNPAEDVWHVAPDTGCRWPAIFSWHIAYRPGNPTGDARVMWEPARFQQLVALGLLAGTGDASLTARAVACLEAQVLSWVRANPFPTGIHYVSAMECGLRVLSLCHAFDLVRTHLSRPRFMWQTFLQLLNVHGTWIAQNISRYSSRGNHTVVEGAALLYLGTLFPEFQDAGEWRAVGRGLLEEEARHLILDDGGSAEQAFGYHAFTLDCFELVNRLLDRYGHPFSPELYVLLRQGEAFLDEFSVRGPLPMVFGDDDNGHALSPFLCLKQSTANISMVNLSDVRRFSSAGYSVWGNEDPMPWKMALDHGPLGLPPCFGHGHADALSLVFQFGGQDILIDPGTFVYGDHVRWRQYFRGTSAHNTVTVDGSDQAVQEGAFMWAHPYEAELVTFEQSSEGRISLLACHDGYCSRLSVIHWRGVVFYPPHTWMVWDCLDGKSVHRLDLNWHCGIEPEEDEQTWRWDVGARSLRMKIFGGEVTGFRGQLNPTAGWRSRRYGHREPILTLRASYEGKLPHEFLTCLTLEDAFPHQADMATDVTLFRDYACGHDPN